MRRRIMSRAAGASAVVLAAALVATGTSSGAASGKTPPDGRIAYSDGGAGRVATANPNGSAIRFVTPDGEFSFQAAWSPDSSHLVYSSDRTTGNDLRIFTVRRDGTGVHRVTGDAVGFNDFQPTYTPDGAGIIYTRCRPDPPAGCALSFVRTDGTGKKLLTAFGHDPADFYADVSPNGKRIAFTRFGAHGILAQVWVMRVDGTHAHPVTKPALEAASPTWTPDGRHLLVTSLFSHLQENVYRLRADGSHLSQLTHSRFPHNATLPDSSPSGSRIAYGDDRAYPDLDGSDIFVMRADGSHKHAILSGMGVLEDPTWGSAPLLVGTGGSPKRTAPPAGALKALPSSVADRWGHGGQVQHKHW